MTDETTSLRDFVEEIPDADRLCRMIGFAAERLMGLEVSFRTGAAHGGRARHERRPLILEGGRSPVPPSRAASPGQALASGLGGAFYPNTARRIGWRE